MKKILLFTFLFSSLLFASNKDNIEAKKKLLLEKQIQKEMEKEKKYAKEQRFYQGENYDLKGSEVNKESLKHLKEIEVDDLDMDDVYD
jgi:hypothetical protein